MIRHWSQSTVATAPLQYKGLQITFCQATSAHCASYPREAGPTGCKQSQTVHPPGVPSDPDISSAARCQPHRGTSTLVRESPSGQACWAGISMLPAHLHIHNAHFINSSPICISAAIQMSSIGARVGRIAISNNGIRHDIICTTCAIS